MRFARRLLLFGFVLLLPLSPKESFGQHHVECFLHILNGIGVFELLAQFGLGELSLNLVSLWQNFIIAVAGTDNALHYHRHQD